MNREIGSRMLAPLCTNSIVVFCLPLATLHYLLVSVSPCFTVQVKSLYLLVIIVSRQNIQNMQYHCRFLCKPQPRPQFGFDVTRQACRLNRILISR